MTVILSSIKRCIRDKESVISAIFLVFLLPYIFSLMFSFESGVENLNLRIVGKENSEIIKNYISTIKDFDKNNENVNFTYETYSKDKFNDLGEKISNDEKTFTVIIDEKNKEIEFKGSGSISQSEKIIEGITEEYFNSISLYTFITKKGNNYTPSSNIIKTTSYEVNSKSENINERKIDYEPYFAVVMLQMALLTGAVIAFKNTFYIKESMGNRVKASPKKILNIISLECIGSFCLIFLEGLIMLLGIIIIYGVNVNLKNILPVLILIAVLSIFAVALGVFITAISKKRSDGEGITSIVVTIIVLASGSLMPQMTSDFEKIPFLELNPFTGISRELNNAITSNYNENLIGAIGISLIVSLILIIISGLIIKKRGVN